MNTTTFNTHAILSAACLCLSLASVARTANALEQRRVINVTTASQLYVAVNDPANRNVTVRLAPGTYLLSTLNNHGVLRPNRGTLRMPPGMSLEGAEKHVDTDGDGVLDPVSDETPDAFAVPGTETIIDGSALDLPGEARFACTGEAFVAPNPMIHVGVDNSISRLTVFAGGNVAISEAANDPVDPNGHLSMEVTDTVLEGSFLIMGFSNCGCTARRARSVLTFSHNVVHGAIFIGMLLQNFLTGDASTNGADGPAIWANITSNLFYGNRRAIIASAGNKGTDGGTMTIHMSGNVFRNNEGNFQGSAGGGSTPTPAVRNLLVVRSDSDTFGEALEGVSLTAGNGEIGDETRLNKLEAEFLRSHFIRDFPETPAEIGIGGGGGGLNVVEVLIRGATVTTSDGVPTEGALSIQDQYLPGIGAGKARLEGSRADFIQWNQGLPAPSAHYFLDN